ncbi:MAG: hypothetical protein AABW45_01130 [Nanoarchaeota archaeon]
MVNINLKTNVSFLLILLGVIILAFIEGVSLSNVIVKESMIFGSEIQLIAFILITIFMLTVSTLKPNRLILVSYSSMTLGLIVIVTGLFDYGYNAPISIKTTQVVIGLILIVAGFFMGKSLKISFKEQEIVKEGIRNYKK